MQNQNPVNLNNQRHLRGVNREDIRQTNLSLILRLAHRNSGISRSDLTTITGLNRSTISDLVAELVDLGLVYEDDSYADTTIGRPSISVFANPKVFSLAFTPYSTHVVLAAISLGGKVILRLNRKITNQPDPYEMAHIAHRMALEILEQLPKDYRLVGIGAAVSGPVNIRTGAVSFCQELDWVDVEFGSYLQKVFGFPAYVDNDSTITCSAERDFGAGKEFQNSVYLFGGHGGIGGGVVIKGSMLRGTAGFASELGHMRISDSKIEDPSGLKGTLEALVRREDLLGALKTKSIDDEQLKLEVLNSNSPKLKRVIDQQIDYLGVAIANLVNIFNPEAVLISGFLSILFEADDYRLLSRIREGAVNGVRERVVIRTASLGSSGILIGSAELAFSKLISDPAGTALYNPIAIQR